VLLVNNTEYALDKVKRGEAELIVAVVSRPGVINR
jgi:hypothetical protein